MNEIVRVHIAGVAYEIDVDAKRDLDKYLGAIRASLGDATDALDDIEIRITELLAEQGVVREGVIRPKHVEFVKERLGEPKDFAGDAGETDGERVSERIRREFASRKYFRDSENGMLGGVIAGFAAYTGWDLTLLRVLTVILAIVTAVFPFIILYIIVWICAPEARTTSDYLSMKGEPINVETIKNATKDFTTQAARGAKTAGEKVTKGAKVASERVARASESVRAAAPEMAAKGAAAGNTALRVVLAVFGVIGLLILIPMMIALVPIVIVGIMELATADIAAKALLIVAVSLLAGAGLMFIVSGFTLVGALFRAKFGRGTGAGLIATLIVAFGLLIAGTVCGSVWVDQVGTNGIDQAVDALGDGHVIEVNDDHVRVELGPIKVNVD